MPVDLVSVSGNVRRTIRHEKNSIVTSFNRNFAKRADGNPNTYAFVASPELTMALTIAGDLCFNPLKDRLVNHNGEKVKLSEPVGDELPLKGFEQGNEGYIAPHGAKTEIRVKPDSQRLQLLTPFPAWDGQDLLNMPLLIKAQENVLPTISLWQVHGSASGDIWRIFPTIC